MKYPGLSTVASYSFLVYAYFVNIVKHGRLPSIIYTQTTHIGQNEKIY